jgi:hypothetical protein
MLSALIAALFIAAADPPAAPPNSQQFPDFAAMDVNKDGRVTKAEFMASLNNEQKKIGERVFAARDANKDGVLTREEANPPRRP